jgi:hypothetical protein
MYPGVFEENISLTGKWSVRSAHGIVLEKSLPIAVPKQVVLPQDPSGDNATTYKAAGALGSGPDHLV